MKQVQDWEFAEEVSPNEWETVDIQIDTSEQALVQAQNYANLNNRRCVVSTSIRYEENGCMQDRGTVPGDPQPIIVNPIK